LAQRLSIVHADKEPEPLSLGVPVVNFPRANAILARAQALFWVRDWIYKGILASGRLLRQEFSRGCRECELGFFNKVCKNNYFRDFKWKKSFLK
jgi:hypothetical protein